MGAPAISTRTRSAPARRSAKPAPRARPKGKPRTSGKARPVAKPRAGTTRRTKPAPRASSAARRPATASGPAGVVMIPVAAVGRTMGAVGDIADCSVARWMTRGRVWIVVLGCLLGGIVAINVWGLGMSAAGSETARKIDALQQENSVLRARAASRGSNAKIEAAAAELGLALPAPDAINYLDSPDGIAAKAADRLSSGEIAVAPPGEAPTEVTEPVLDPVTGMPVEPAIDPATGMPLDPLAVPAPIDPSAEVPVATDPVTGAPPAP